jgi:hypothetical protein
MEKKRLTILAALLTLAAVIIATWRAAEVYHEMDRSDQRKTHNTRAPKRENAPHGWHRIKGQPMDNERKKALDQLSQLGYVSGYEKAPMDRAGVTKWDKDKAHNGYNLIVSGQGPEALLMDMEGNILHKWRSDYGAKQVGERSNFLRRAHLLDNGDILVIFEGASILAKLDKDSNVIWTVPSAHHDIYVTKENTIYTLTRKRLSPDRPGLARNVIEDFVTSITPDGQIIDQLSVVKSFLNSDYAAQVAVGLKAGGDITHTNTVQVLEESYESAHPSLKKGNIIICMRTISSIAALNPEKRAVEWSMQSMFRAQHDSTVLEDGKMLVFDNRGQVYLSSQGLKLASRIVEFDMKTNEIVFEYPKGPDPSFYSGTSGALQRLPNGNTLIIESWAGRALEVDPEGEIVWEYYSPYRAGEDKDLIPHLCDVVRYDESRLKWLKD